ncbi:rhomboid-domain-containing protein [Laetiporus sulphureus 93-53]|uniref:Rhomboid-domain-containing protein n=1 Tax=Laetiporus sulphureus 93-53 TaxID=1314785 RepID=A0A165IEI8_9APHY|nr:rhomboid-domain-containing protein [Laetiporus sulphureus 93-53]KZT12965.1 rhomboid-domain-containing protein [Laetiporus sulphureus 93-53]
MVDSVPHRWILWGILGLNGIVFVMWNAAVAQYKATGDPRQYLYMARNFLVSYENFSAGRLWTLVTACFSHGDITHLFVNAFSLYFMAPAVLRILHNGKFLVFYLGAGMLASLISLQWNHAIEKKPSHYASRAIYAIIAFFACVAPKATLYLFGMIPLPAWLFVTGIFLWDGSSTLTHTGGQMDTAGHVGGILSGIAYYCWMMLRR